MKKILLLLAAPFVFFTAQSETITQGEADNIVLECMNREIRQYTLYAKEDVQQKMTITSIAGEVLEVNYRFWVYYVNYIDNVGQYIIVKESNGNLLEINVKSDAKPDDLVEWRIVKEEKNKVCNVNNPLTDLPWLKAKTASLIQIQYGSIHQCVYGNGETGFFVAQGDIRTLYNCNGEILCAMGGVTGVTTCSPFNIDFEGMLLIWWVENGFVNGICEYDKPVEDLLWLKKIVEEFTAYSNSVAKRHFKIYQCTYVDEGSEKVGFIVSPICVDCGDDTAMLYRCTGRKLCSMGGILGVCDEYNITNKELIWEINN